MDVVFFVGMISFGLMLIGWIGYSILTNQVIRDQEREISRLIKEIEQLRTALHGRASVKNLRVYRAPINRPECTIVRNDGEDPFKEW